MFFLVQYLTGGLAQVCSIYPAHLTRVPLWPIVHLVLQVYLICQSKLSLSHISFFTRSNCEGMSDECQNGHTKWAHIGDPTSGENFANYGLHLSQQMECILHRLTPIRFKHRRFGCLLKAKIINQISQKFSKMPCHICPLQ